MNNKTKHLIAVILNKIGIKPKVSFGICGSTRYGYGKLDVNGYWKYPLKWEYKEKK